MVAYEKVHEALFALCENEGLQLIEAELENKKIMYFRFADRVILNTNYHWGYA